jgi:uncharacterized protein (TIGR02117 family)
MITSLDMRITCLLLLVFLQASCVAAPAPPPAGLKCETTRTVYVISHGWHTGIAVNREDLVAQVPSLEDKSGKGEYLEVGWGDERFYQAKKITAGLALQAILWPTATVLHVVEIAGTPQHYFSKSEVMEITVPLTGYEKLLVYISESFARNSDNNIIVLGVGLYGNSRFYRATGDFHAFNTCNTWVSKAIASTGYPINSAKAVTAEDVLSQLRKGPGNAGNCYSVRHYNNN